jgi:GTP-binding protein
VIATSSATGEGLQELSAELLRKVDAMQADTGGGPAAELQAPEELAEHMVFRPAGREGFEVERVGPRSFAVRGRGIERLLQRHDMENADAMAYLEGRLRRLGVLRALEDEGFQPGDEIEIAGTAFELDPS